MTNEGTSATMLHRGKRARLLSLAGLLTVSLLNASLAAAEDTIENSPTAEIQAFLQQHCFDCHSGGTREGGLDLQRLGSDLSDPEQMRRWVLIHDRVARGEMPPKGEPRPAESKRSDFVTRLAASLTKADKRRNEVVLRRLNRIEYENTIRDLFGVRVALVDMLPEDASAHGFDNIGAALAISTEQMEVYLTAAEAAIQEVFGPAKKPDPIHVRYPLSKDNERHHGKLFLKTDEGVVLFNSGYCPSILRSFRPKVKGTYRLRIHAKTYQTERPVIMAIYGGDVITRIREHHLIGHYDVQPGDDWTVIELEDYLHRYNTFHPKPFKLSHRKNKRFEGIGLLIGEVEVEGPLEAWPPASRAKLLGSVNPETASLADAQQILTRILPKAFRRPVKAEEAAPYVELVSAALDVGRPFDEALAVGLKGVLCSPEFLFLDEAPQADTSATAGGPNEPISDFALASRLSYFLFSSLPDAELFDAARTGQLRKPEMLRKQTERMLKDPKSRALVENFTGQWLNLRDINFTEPDRRLYPEFDDLLRASMVEESHRYFRAMLDGNRSLLEFVDSDWAIVNQRLAELYGIEGVAGQKFRRVQLPADSVRGGVLTQASVLKVTANGTNTSPVVRGTWVLKNILGTSISPPPAGVPAIEPDTRGATTIRQQLDKHRNTAACATCHVKIDPPGFALECFDVMGGYREWYRSSGEGERVNRFIDNVGVRKVLYRKGPNVDASGTLADGRSFQNIREFKRLLLAEPDQLVRCLSEKVLTYALGRGLGFSDRAAIEEIVANVLDQGYGFRALIHEVVQSEVFKQP